MRIFERSALRRAASDLHEALRVIEVIRSTVGYREEGEWLGPFVHRLEDVIQRALTELTGEQKAVKP